jgi:hypothetical protein
MPTTFDPARELGRLARLYAVIEEWLDLHAVLLPVAASSVSAWSAEQHIAHLALANELIARNLESLAKHSGLLVVQGGEAAPGAQAVLASGVIPRGQAQAPRIVWPPAVIERGLMLCWLRDGARALAALDPRTLVATDSKIPHQLLGPLDAPQWSRFAHVHTRHHLAIAREVLVAQGRDVSELDPL